MSLRVPLPPEHGVSRMTAFSTLPLIVYVKLFPTENDAVRIGIFPGAMPNYLDSLAVEGNYALVRGASGTPAPNMSRDLVDVRFSPPDIGVIVTLCTPDQLQRARASGKDLYVFLKITKCTPVLSWGGMLRPSPSLDATTVLSALKETTRLLEAELAEVRRQPPPPPPSMPTPPSPKRQRMTDLAMAQALATTQSTENAAAITDALMKALQHFSRASADRGRCAVCLEAIACMTFPCGHMCACETCLPPLQDQCPICRQRGRAIKTIVS
jgi:hypothetical protein